MQAEQVNDSNSLMKFDPVLLESNQNLKSIYENDWINFRSEWNKSLLGKKYSE